jgi:hypothetical protein
MRMAMQCQCPSMCDFIDKIVQTKAGPKTRDPVRVCASTRCGILYVATASTFFFGQDVLAGINVPYIYVSNDRDFPLQALLPEGVRSALASACARVAPSTTPSEASAMLAAAARIRVPWNPATTGALLAASLRNRGGACPQATAGAVWALARQRSSWNHHCARQVLDAVCLVAPYFAPLDTALTVWGLAELQWPLGPWERDAVRRAVVAAAPHLQARETAMVVRGVVVLGLARHRGSRTWAALYKAIERSVASPARQGGPSLQSLGSGDSLLLSNPSRSAVLGARVLPLHICLCLALALYYTRRGNFLGEATYSSFEPHEMQAGIEQAQKGCGHMWLFVAICGCGCGVWSSPCSPSAAMLTSWPTVAALHIEPGSLLHQQVSLC